MAEKLFKIVKRIAFPVLSRESAGDAEVFTLDEVAKKLRQSKHALESLHDTLVDAAAERGDGGKQIVEALAEWQNDPDKVLIRKNDHGRLSDADFAWFLALAKQQGMDIFKREVFPEFIYNEARKRMDLQLVTSIKRMRGIAHATGLYAGIRIVHEPPGASMPVKSTCYVTKIVQGQKCEFEGHAYLDDYYPGENTGTVWDVRPGVCNDRCAERDALSKAFPELDRLYLSMEFTKGRRGPSSSPPRGGATEQYQKMTEEKFDELLSDGHEAAQPSELSPGEDQQPTDDDHPLLPLAFHMRLMELGLRDEKKRNHLIVQVSGEHPGLLDSNAPKFYAMAIETLKKNPERWGVQVM